jgi:hypothetical protein
MKINQLFKANIPEDLFLKIYKLFGINNLDEDYNFSKADLIRLKTIEQLDNYIEDLSQYYLPCKAKLYLLDIDENKAITILRQILKLFNMSLVSKQKYVKQKKTTLYYISKLNDDDDNIHAMKVENHNVTLNFS